MAMKRAYGHKQGHEKEPPNAHGPSGKGGMRPNVHSHSARPKRSIKGGGKTTR